MTTPEHTLVGIHLAFATGCHHRWGWVAIAVAGIAANLPDLDGLPMLMDMQRFEAGHRVWGHNFLAILLMSLLLAWTQTRYRWIDRAGSFLTHKFVSDDSQRLNTSLEISQKGNNQFFVFALIAMLSQTVHLPCDMVVSGGNGLSDWPIQPFWPFAQTGYIFPMIPWGDVGPTVIMMAGVIWIAKRPKRLQQIAVGTLLVLLTYLVVRWWSRVA